VLEDFILFFQIKPAMPTLLTLVENDNMVLIGTPLSTTCMHLVVGGTVVLNATCVVQILAYNVLPLPASTTVLGGVEWFKWCQTQGKK
jgi:hypothetical protein